MEGNFKRNMVRNEEDINKIILNAYKQYPESEVQDIAKLIYQNEFGGGHMISDREASLERLKKEFGGIGQSNSAKESFEYIGNGLYRFNLCYLNDIGIKLETVNAFFCQTANSVKGNVKSYEQKLDVFLRCLNEGLLPFDLAHAQYYLKDLKNSGYPPVSHSRKYREAYYPAYRIISSSYRDFIEVFRKIDTEYYNGKKIIVAIDGMCGSGKSMLAGLIEGIYDCNLFHMDDFFLRPGQRTKKRAEETGGNVDYERFGEEVINGIKSGQSFDYRKYDCRHGRLGDKINVLPKKLSIIEGSYSMHPSFIDNYDLKIFLKTDNESQKNRLILRDGEDMYKRFVSEWIPLENRYFNEFGIEDKCDIIYTID